MKTSFRKLRGFGLHLHEKRDRRCRDRFLPKLDEISQASQDMHDMRDCYDSLLSAAAATTNSAYELSESLREMGDCLLEKTALNDDEDGGRVLLMLGKVQFEIQKLVDNYRSHISRTITVPSESLLNELRIVEEMKRQCDEKRDAFEDMRKRQKEKGRSKSSKGEYVSSHQLQTAQDEYDEEATVFVFRMKSLKRGQSRSLLTQAARHHAAQMTFFRKALKSLEAIEPHVKLVTEQQHIDYQFSGLEDDDRDSVFLTDDEEEDDDSDDGYETRDDGELSFDYRRNDQGKDVSISGNPMEVDHVDLTFPQVATVNAVQENVDKKPILNSATFGRDFNTGSKSAPLSADNNFDPAERFRQMRQSSARKFHTYVLPTPKSPVSSGADTHVPQARRASVSVGAPNLWHSSPLEYNQYEKTLGKEKFSGPIVSNTQSILKESNNNNKTSPLPPPEGRTSPQREPRSASSIKKVKRQAFSGPLTSNAWSAKPILSASGPINSTGHPQLFSGSLLRTPLARPASSPKLSASAAFVSSPKISELHELPRPPAHLYVKKPPNLVGYSAPLVGSKGTPDLSTTDKPTMKSTASPTLPIPPETLSRSHSIPSRGQREMEIVPKPLETRNLKMAECIVSPPLTPVFVPFC